MAASHAAKFSPLATKRFSASVFWARFPWNNCATCGNSAARGPLATLSRSFQAFGWVWADLLETNVWPDELKILDSTWHGNTWHERTCRDHDLKPNDWRTTWHGHETTCFATNMTWNHMTWNVTWQHMTWKNKNHHVKGTMKPHDMEHDTKPNVILGDMAHVLEPDAWV